MNKKNIIIIVSVVVLILGFVGYKLINRDEVPESPNVVEENEGTNVTEDDSNNEDKPSKNNDSLDEEDTNEPNTTEDDLTNDTDNNLGDNSGSDSNGNTAESDELTPEEIIANNIVEGTFKNGSDNTEITFASASGEFMMDINFCDDTGMIMGKYSVKDDKVLLKFEPNQYTGYDSSKDTEYTFTIINENRIRFDSGVNAEGICGPKQNADYVR